MKVLSRFGNVFLTCRPRMDGIVATFEISLK